ncbi:MAG: FAD-dependent oxidoreductase [Gaiellales bacterium]
MSQRAALIAVDDEPVVARSVERDLLSRYADSYRVLRAESGAAALDLVRRVLDRGEEVALVVTDQRMPEMSGVELLARLREVAPETKRVLLTAYADTDVAIRAINEVALDHYLLKPWDPPDDHLFPVLDDLLADWQSTRTHPFAGVTVVGHRWSPDSHRMRDFLTRNLVPYRWLDAGDPAAAPMLEAAGVGQLPVVALPDGTLLTRPTLQDVAERIGLRTQAELDLYDLAIVGGGPAGLAAAVYGASEGLRTLLVEHEAPGGQAGQSSRIENYLGFPAGLSGGDLARRAAAQAQRLGAEMLTTRQAVGLEVRERLRAIRLADGGEIAAHTVLIATGVSYRRLEAPGVDRLTGAGAYYGAAASEAQAMTGEDVFVVGGANSAGQAAVFFSRFAARVTIVCRGEGLERGMSRYLIDQIEAIPTIEVRTESQVVEALGSDRLEAVMLERGGARETLPAAGLFIFIGARPATDWLDSTVARTPAGFVLSGRDAIAPDWPLEREPFLLETSVPGVFVAGDVREGSIKRVASAVGEGSMSVAFVHQYIRGS